MTSPDRSPDPIALLEELLAIDSVNAGMGGPGEAAMAERVVAELRDIGADVRVTDGAGPGRPNVIATLPGDPRRGALLLESHLDTVAQPRERIAIRREGDRLYGRGACDTKGSMVGMFTVMRRLADVADRPTIVFAGASDEEVTMLGSKSLVGQLPPVDGAIVGEPTSLLPIRAHNGFSRFRITARGKAAHTSRAYLGVNAIAAISRATLALQDELFPRLLARPHPLAGPGLITAAVVKGGVAANLVPEWAEITVDRRLSPGEDPDAALAEIDAILAPLIRDGDDLIRNVPDSQLPAVETPADHPLVRAVEAACAEILGRPVTAGGVPYGTDASHLSGVGGIPCVVLGPGSIDQAHTEDEWVPIPEVLATADILERIIRGFGTGA
ncbi:MAG: M20/M25/M40 family metallo-hydrolase [Chloroflexota bacterium]